MKKLEAKFTTKLTKWMKYNMLYIPTYGWEVKYPRNKKYTFKSDKSFAKELRNLLKWYKIIIYKFSDIARLGTIHDGFTANGRAFLFITWNGKKFYAIEATELKSWIDIGRDCLYEEEAYDLAEMVDEVK